MSVVILRGDARSLPLADESVDLVVTSPPYWGQRSYTDAGEHYDGQIGSEPTPGEFIAALLRCTSEWARVLKPSGSIFVDLGDKYDSGTTTARVNPGTVKDGQGQGWHQGTPRVSAGRAKSMLGLPWRYALGCMDDLGLILRAEIVWNKPNGLPESVSDRVRRSHEQVFHFTRQPRYFAAVDEIREAHTMKPQRRPNGRPEDRTPRLGQPKQTWPTAQRDEVGVDGHPLGKLPGSVWDIPSAPLAVPAHLGVDHFAAYPPELVRRIVLGWSPPGICTECGEGRRPVVDRRFEIQSDCSVPVAWKRDKHYAGNNWHDKPRGRNETAIAGYACPCTPYTDHPERRGKDFHAGTDRTMQGMNDRNGGERYRRYMEELANPRGPVREYHLDGWDAPPTRPAIVLDPFGGTGTSALVASVLGRTGVTVDRSADYCRLAAWRTSDPAERARALGVPKPPPVMSGQGSLFDQEAAS